MVELFGPHAKGDIVGHSIIGQVNVLRHIANGALPLAAVSGGDGLAVDSKYTSLRLERAKNNIHCGGFAAAGGADKAHCAVRRDGEINPLQRRLRSFGVAVADFLKPDGLRGPQRVQVALLSINGLQAHELLVQGLQRRGNIAQVGEGPIDLL